MIRYLMINFLLILSIFSINAYNDQIEAILQESFPFTGPNCHNTALRALKIQKFKRYVDNREISLILKHYCVEVEEKSPMSLGVLFHHSDPLHSFVYLDNDLVFTKNGASKRKVALPRYQRLVSMLDFHRLAPNRTCRREQGRNCNFQVRYYQCEQVSSVMSELEETLEEMQKTRDSFFDQSLRHDFLMLAKDEMGESDQCLLRKEVLHSLSVALYAGNMASRTSQEFEQTKAFEDDFKALIKSYHCP